MSNIPQNDVLPGKSVSSTTSDEEEGMHISKFLMAGALSAGTVAALKRPFSVELNTSHTADEGPVRRLRNVADGELTTTIPGHPDILTVYDLVKNAVDQWKDKECLGSRRVVKKHEEEKQRY